MKHSFKEYRYPGDDFIFYGKEDVDSMLSMLFLQREILSDAADELYKRNLNLCKEIDTLKAKLKKSTK